jgi:hypothetical protein
MAIIWNTIYVIDEELQHTGFALVFNMFDWIEEGSSIASHLVEFEYPVHALWFTFTQS